MNTLSANYKEIVEEIKPYGAKLVAVSKTKPVEDIVSLYNAGQRIFGENKVQELVAKAPQLAKDIHWHFIGHLQTNKVKTIAPFVSLIHSVDSFKLLTEINKQALQNKRVINCLLQVFIADEETKFGLSKAELLSLLSSPEFAQLQNVHICGLMGMATNTDDEQKIAREFQGLQDLFLELKHTHFDSATYFKELSMGMSSDYKIALKYGATLTRLGTILFGNR
jgi:pyridoxal phosphate enzyme (YggS family)